MRGDDITGRHLHLKRTEHMGQGSPGVSAMVQPFSCANNKDITADCNTKTSAEHTLITDRDNPSTDR